MSVGLLSRGQLGDVDSLLKSLPEQHEFTGAFFDPFHPDLNWSSQKCGLFLAWWSFTPSVCRSCGSSGHWFPSLEEEYRCKFCGAGAGSTKTNEIVQETNVGEAHDEGDVDESEDDEVEGALGALALDGMPDLSFHAAAVPFLETLKACEASCPAFALDPTTFPTLLRVAINLIHLALLPDSSIMHSDGDSIIKYACLFVSCSVVPGADNLPFPIFQRKVPCDLQWCDVYAVASETGLLDNVTVRPKERLHSHVVGFMSLFEKTERPPGVVWGTQEDTITVQETKILDLMLKKQKEHASIDHSLAIVICELLRSFETEHKSSSGSGASEHHKKLQEWKGRNKSKQFSQLLDSEAASIFLTIVAKRFEIPALELADFAYRSKLYGGETRFIPRLKTEVEQGQYSLPLGRRVTPCESPWACVYRALFSEDRHVMSQLIFLLTTTAQPTKEIPAAVNLLQGILRKHGAFSSTQFFYCFKLLSSNGSLKDTAQNAYVCIQTGGNWRPTKASSASESGDDSALFLSLNGRRSIKLNKKGSGQEALLNSVGSSEKVVEAIKVPTAWCNPLVVTVETPAAKVVAETCADETSGGKEKWLDAVVRMQARSNLKKKVARTDPDDPRVMDLIRDCKPQSSSTALKTFSATRGGGGSLAGMTMGDGQAESMIFDAPNSISEEDIKQRFKTFCDCIPTDLIVALGDSQAAGQLLDYQFLIESGAVAAPVAGAAGSKKAVGKEPTTKSPLLRSLGKSQGGGKGVGKGFSTIASQERMNHHRQKRGRSATLLDRGSNVRRELKEAVSHFQQQRELEKLQHK